MQLFFCQCKLNFPAKKLYLKHLSEKLLVDTHKYPLCCHQPACESKQEFDSIYNLGRHLLRMHEKVENNNLPNLPMTIHKLK